MPDLSPSRQAWLRFQSGPGAGAACSVTLSSILTRIELPLFQGAAPKAPSPSFASVHSRLRMCPSSRLTWPRNLRSDWSAGQEGRELEVAHGPGVAVAVDRSLGLCSGALLRCFLWVFMGVVAQMVLLQGHMRSPPLWWFERLVRVCLLLSFEFPRGKRWTPFRRGRIRNRRRCGPPPKRSDGKPLKSVEANHY